MLYRVINITDHQGEEKTDENSMVRKSRVYHDLFAHKGRSAVLTCYDDMKMTVTSRLEDVSIVDNEVTLETLNSVYTVRIEPEKE